MSKLKPIIAAHQVEEAVKTLFKTWMPTYLKEIEDQYNLDLNLPDFRSYTVVNEFSDWPETQLPRLLVVSPGWAGPPRVEGDGTYTAFFRVGIGIVVASREREDTNRNIKLYTAAACAMLLQQQGLGGLSGGIDLESVDHDEVSSDMERTLAAAQIIAVVTVPGVLTRRGGPAVPTPPDPNTIPGEDWPIAQTADIEFERLGGSE